MNLQYGAGPGCKFKGRAALIDATFPVYLPHLDPGLKGPLNKARLSLSHLVCSLAYDALTHTKMFDK